MDTNSNINGTRNSSVGVVNKIKNKLQSKKFWLVVSIFAIVSILYFVIAWVMTVLHIIAEKTTVQIFELGTSVLNTIIITYCAVNLVEKAINSESMIGKFINKVMGEKND